jgi:tetratricopeptide (TPR) repeat protein
MRHSSLLLSLVTCAAGFGDIVHFKDGSKREGTITIESKEEIQLSVLFGAISVQVTIPRERIARIEKRQTKNQKILEDYQSRLRSLDDTKPDQWYNLGIWCEQKKHLAREARRAYQIAVEIDSQHDGANLKLGNVQHNGVWMTRQNAAHAKHSDEEITLALDVDEKPAQSDSVALFEKYLSESLESQRQRAVKAESALATERKLRLTAERKVKELEDRVGRLERQLSRSSITIPERRPVIIIRNQGQ